MCGPCPGPNLVGPPLGLSLLYTQLGQATGKGEDRIYLWGRASLGFGGLFWLLLHSAVHLPGPVSRREEDILCSATLVASRVSVPIRKWECVVGPSRRELVMIICPVCGLRGCGSLGPLRWRVRPPAPVPQSQLPRKTYISLLPHTAIQGLYFRPSPFLEEGELSARFHERVLEIGRLRADEGRRGEGWSHVVHIGSAWSESRSNLHSMAF